MPRIGTIGKIQLVSAAAFLLLLEAECGPSQIVRLESPSGRSAIEVQRGFSPAARLEVYLSTPGHWRRRVFRSPNEGFFQFAEAAWTADESKVALCFNGTASFEMAFDVDTGREVPFDPMKESIEVQIRRHYVIPPTERDVLQWTYSSDAREQFARR